MKRNRWQILTVMLIACNLIPAFAQPDYVAIESRVDRSKITIGDRIRYSVIVTHGDSIQVEMPEYGLNLGAFEILDFEDPEPQRVDDKIIQTRDFIISTFDVGEYEIPPVGVRFAALGDSNWQELKTEAITIEVESLKPSEEGDIRDIKPPYEIERNWANIIRISVAAVVLVLIGVLIYYFIRQRRAGKSLIPRREKPPRPPHELALEALDALLQSDLLEKQAVKQFYIELSDIIRTYIEGRYFILAMEMTTSQLLGHMKSAQIENDVIDMVQTFLEQCDFVKFAKYRPEKEEIESNVKLAYDIVHQTKILPQFQLEDNGTDETPLTDKAETRMDAVASTVAEPEQPSDDGPEKEVAAS